MDSYHNLRVLVLATQSVPRFIQEITDVYAREGETAVFECIYSGNPAPGILQLLIIITNNYYTSHAEDYNQGQSVFETGNTSCFDTKIEKFLKNRVGQFEF